MGIRILIADDDRFFREFLKEVLKKDPEITEVYTAVDGRDAVEKTLSLKPDVVLMDVIMPGYDGYQAIREIMARYPVPIVMITAYADSNPVYKALLAGAMDLIPKPGRDMSTSQFVDTIIRKVKLLAGLKVSKRQNAEDELPGSDGKCIELEGHPYHIVAIGASTGGPSALAQILGNLPTDFPLPIVIAQHIWEGFEGSLAGWLGSVSKVKVQVARDMTTLQPGNVYLAPTNSHMVVDGCLIRLKKEPVTHKYPSVDVLFQSVADSFGKRAIAVLLTGLGSDGAHGLLKIKNAGGYTIAQDESTSTVFGMPKVAIELGAAREVLPIDAIASRLTELANVRKAQA